MKYKTGDIVFFAWDGFFMKVVQFHNRLVYGERGFSHVGIITKVNKETVQIHEALSKGFVKSDYPIEFLNGKIGEGIIEIASPSGLKDVEKNADKYLGRGYAWFDIFGIALSFLFNFKFLRITGAKKLICSEAVARILYDSSNKRINFEKEYDKPYDLITPMDIYYSKQIE